MYIAVDSQGSSNPYLTLFSGKLVWGPDRKKAEQFVSEELALEKGREAMPNVEMAKRVVAKEF